jgi:alpha-L-fucosidase 2
MKVLLYRLMESLVATLHRATVGCGARASRIALALVLACVLSLAAPVAFAAGPTPAAVDRTYAAANDVTWQELGRDENDSMPIGNGDVGANVWTEQNGDLVLLVAKSDAWTEIGQLVKLGRVRIQLSPNPFAGASEFRQTLHLANGSVELASGANHLRIWVDANHPVLHVEANLAHPAVLRASLELWRTSHPYADPSPSKGGFFEFGSHNIPVDFEADTVLPATANRVEWFHLNQQSIYPFILTHERLEVLLAKYPDPLLHRCFGAMLSGSGLKSAGDRSLQSSVPSRTPRLDLVALTTPQAASPQAWQAGLDALARQVNNLPIEVARAAHRAWWRAFWNRSWIHVTGTPDAEKVSQGYILQRYMLAASSRGAYPAKYNGSLFTVGRDLPAGAVSTNALHGPDYRAWGNSYWNQNNRLLYWPLIATGDFDLLRPWFAMYSNALSLAQDRTRLYFHHPGAEFIETMNFWGLPNLSDFGWDNPGNEVQSRYMRYHIQGALEVVAQMLDEYEITRDSAFAHTQLVPLADSVAAFYANHWPRGADGKLRFSPAQAIETYQLDAVNPTPDIAALRNVLPRLIDLPVAAATPAQRAAWKQTLSDLPPIPTGRTAAGKLPPLGKGDPDGMPVILPAEHYGPTKNMENPELYPVFPYRLYAVDKPDLTLARNTFAARLFPQDTCWGQDGPEAALLGLTATAQKAAIDAFTAYGNQRFRWFWRSGHDWIPDLDNGGGAMSTLQLMLLQTDGRRIRLLPAWPPEWTADFKLHAPYQTTVEGHVENGKLTRMVVTPASRAKDVAVGSTP